MSELETDPVVSSDGGADTATEDTLYVEIHVMVGTECITIYRVPPGEYLIGRDSSCHLTVDAENVSRMHARLAFHGHRILVEDLDSANGTRIGGIRICLPTPIQNGTEVHIGSARLLVQFSDETLSKIAAALSDPTLGLEPIRLELSQEPYFVTGTIAEGGMGLVVKARDQRVRRLVAMKVLRGGYEYAADKLLRFVGEAQLTGQLEHPNIVPVYQLGISPNGQTFYTMKYVQGQTLEEILIQLHAGNAETLHAYPLAKLITVFQKVGDAVAFAHSRGVVHRDLKPANIMIGRFGEVLVMDWGLAKRVNEGSLSQSASGTGAPVITHHPPNQTIPDSPRGFYTLEGAVVGTPPYISPEQARGEGSPDARSDIHVLGSILYTILSLRPPLLQSDVEEVISAASENRFVPITKMVRTPENDGSAPPKLLHCPGGRLPEGLVAVVEKAMAALPANRYQTVEELQEDITSWQNGFATKAEQAGFFRQLLLLLARRKREATFLAIFLVVLAWGLAYFLHKLADDNEKIQKKQAEIQKNQTDLTERNQQLAANQKKTEELLEEIRDAAAQNQKEALDYLRVEKDLLALENIPLAHIGFQGVPKKESECFLIEAIARARTGSIPLALECFRKAEQLLPGSVPLDLVETDLDPANDLPRPKGGWSWEKKLIENLEHARAQDRANRPRGVQSHLRSRLHPMRGD
ncbi:MAG: hypothetical protein RLZZ244_2626 [Verrucomicrobiota bacterium]|jgi:serine/threonine protein kinase